MKSDARLTGGHHFSSRDIFRRAWLRRTRRKISEAIFRRPMNWAMEKSLLAAYTPTLRTEPVLRTVPVLRMAYFPKRAYDALFSKTLMLQSLRDLRWCGTKSGNLRVSRHLSGWAYPVLDCAGVECGRRARGDWGRAASPPPCPLPRGHPSGAARQLPWEGSLWM